MVEESAHPDEAELTESDELPKVPISFWVMLAVVGLYLGWRLVQGLAWLVDRALG